MAWNLNRAVFFMILAAGLLLLNESAHGQGKDFRSWNDISVEAELTDDIDLQAGIGLRLDKNATSLDENLYELELQYKGIKDYDLSAGYRFSMKRDLNYFERIHRWTIDGQLEKEAGRFDLDFRTRLQMEYFPFSSFEDSYEYYLRDKITVTYNINDWPADPYLAFEHYAPLNNKPFAITDKNRYIIGTEIDLDKGFELEVSYRYQRHYDDLPEYDYILTLGLKYEL